MDETEIRLKEIIIERYGSLKKFCEKIDMPWTTLDSILKRGVANSNITNVMKITKELGLDTESLALGNIKEKPICDYIVYTNNQTPIIIETYNQLPTSFKRRLEKYATALLDLSSLEEPMLNAANQRTDIELPREIDTSDNDIMDDENF